MRKNEGKVKLTKALLMPAALSGLVSVLEFGEEKYDAAEKKSWLKYDLREVQDSLLRHTMALVNGEVTDPESGLPHSSHILFNAAVIEELMSYYSSSGSSSQMSPEDLT